MKASISYDSAERLFSRMAAILASADTWHGRAMEMRVLFDSLLNSAAGGLRGEGSFWKDAIDTIHPAGSDDHDDDCWREELHEWRRWFNSLQHEESAAHRGRYEGFGRHTVLDVIHSMASYVNAISGCPVDPRIIGACVEPVSGVSCGDTTIVMLCELCSAPGRYSEAAKLMDALRDIPHKKKLYGMGSKVNIQSIVYTDPMLHFRDSSAPDDYEYKLQAPVDHALRRAVGTLKSAGGERWLVWRTSQPKASSAEAVEALNKAILDLGVRVVPMATTPEAERQFKAMWRKVCVYRLNYPMLPDNMINSVLLTIVRESLKEL